MRDPTKTAGLPPAEVEFLTGIDQCSWAVTKVVPPEGEPGYRFAYTTGLFFRFRHPELLIYGLPAESMLQTLNTLGNQIRLGKSYGVGIAYKDIFEDRRCQFQPVDNMFYKDRLAASNWFYEGMKYPTLQCYWPDQANRFPWETGCDATVAASQPILFRIGASRTAD
jgi:hypothetical protein